MQESIDSHLTRARQHLDNLDFEDAHNELISAIKLNDTNAPVYELLGETLVEQGKPEEARDAFRRAIELEKVSGISSGGFEKYLWMGQLSEEGGDASITYYRQGVKRLIAFIGKMEEEEQYMLRNRLASVYSAMAELYMTDLWYVSPGSPRFMQTDPLIV